MESSRVRKVGLIAVTLAFLAAASACASGDGVPTATIENGLDTCIVEASYLEFGFTTPIGPTGRMSSREVVEGSDVAYAVVMTPVGAEKCVDLARKTGGELWVTNQRYTAQAGDLTQIRFDANTASKVEAACTPQYVEGLKRFTRLTNVCEAGSQ